MNGPAPEVEQSEFEKVIDPDGAAKSTTVKVADIESHDKNSSGPMEGRTTGSKK